MHVKLYVQHWYGGKVYHAFTVNLETYVQVTDPDWNMHRYHQHGSICFTSPYGW